ncbi:hypothetical protein AWV79_15060 [Cupriavidus sp. UYMMa02A]|nr:hypothetical protein AWV79_15060 [Cupriavidus sp. UYMMa02A]
MFPVKETTSLLASGVCSGIASILLRVAGSHPATANLLSLPQLLRGSAIVVYGLGFVLYAIALRRLPLTLAYPLMVATAIVIITAYSAAYDTGLNARHLIGGLVIVAGVWLLISK